MTPLINSNNRNLNFFLKKMDINIFRLISPLLLAFLMVPAADLNAQSRRAQAADEAFENMRYSLAIPKYKKAYSRSKGNKVEKNRITYKLAECYRLTNDMRRAESYFKRLVRLNYDRTEPLVLLRLADAQRANGDYEDALENYKTYVERVPDDPRGQVGIESCELAMEWKDNPSNFEIEELKRINSRENDFSPAYSEPTGNAIIFTSSRDGSTGKDEDEWTGLNFTDLYYTKVDLKGDWSNPVLIDETEAVNTDANEGQSAFNENFSTMYFTRCTKDNVAVNGCQIYRTNKQGRSWGEPEKIDLGGDSTSVFGHPAISPDEKMLIFSSPKNGGAGGKDLWIATRKSEGGSFSTPRNIGPVINTVGDEVFPYLRGDSVLYFASTGHPGMGGLDIFKSVRLEDDKWADPVNLKPPINTHYDDFGITFHPDGLNEGFFSSNRRGGRGGDDVWYFVNPPLLYTVTGKVLDESTLQAVEEAEVSLVSSDGTTVTTHTNTVGYYEFTDEQVKAGTTFEIIVSKEDYFNEKAMETTVGLDASKDFEMDFRLEPIPEDPIVLPEILYDLGKWDLKPQFQDSLQGLIQTLDANETIVVELAAHTDTRDTEERNDILSQKRAESVVEYLIKRGIDPDRLIAKGYGERVPRKLQKTIVRDGVTFPEGAVLDEAYIDSLSAEVEKEAAHQLNRRTEFTIISKDYVPKPKVRTDVEGSEIEVVVNPEEQIIDYRLTPNGLIQADCIINGFTLSFIYDRRTVRPTISLGSALRLLREGAIDKDDFVGNPEQILGEGTIANRAVFIAETLRIANVTLTDVEVQVDKQLMAQMMLGPVTLGKIGEFEIDDKNQKIKFK